LGVSILQSADTAHLQQLRRETYTFVFGEERTGKEIVKDIKKALSKERAL
jgi:molybdate-binding protein